MIALWRAFRERRQRLDLAGRLILEFATITSLVTLLFVPFQVRDAPWQAVITGVAGLILAGLARRAYRHGAGRRLANLTVGAAVGVVSVLILATGGVAFGPVAAVPILIVMTMLILPRGDLRLWIPFLLLLPPAAWLMRSSGWAFPLPVSDEINETALIRLPVLLTILGAMLGFAYSTTMAGYRRAIRRASHVWETETAYARRDHERLRHFAQLAADVLWETDEMLRLSYVSRGFEMTFRLTREQCIGLTPAEVYERFSGYEEIDFSDGMAPLHARETLSDQRLAWRRDGMTLILSNSAKPVFDPRGKFLGYRGVMHDITEIVKLQNALKRRASRDPLTGLRNRRAFIGELDAAIGEQHAPVALLYIDLDNFKGINDLGGHEAGDQTLVMVAEQLRAAFPDAVVGRIGGDEFVCLIENAREDVVVNQANRFVRRLSDVGIVRSGHSMRIGASVGIHVATPKPGDTCDSWLHAADEATYRAKSEGRGRVALSASA